MSAKQSYTVSIRMKRSEDVKTLQPFSGESDEIIVLSDGNAVKRYRREGALLDNSL